MPQTIAICALNGLPGCLEAGPGFLANRARRAEPLGEVKMIGKLALTAFLALAICVPGKPAAAQNNTLGGAIVGGAAGAILGGAVGGGRGAAVGAILGAGTGAAIASQGDPRPGGYY